jgi:hypothetical protein
VKKQLVLSMIGFLTAGDLMAQTARAPQPAGEVAVLARGWALLAEGHPAKASQLAADLLRTSPRSVAVLSLLVDAEIERGGPMAALDAYDRWLERRHMEDGYALRRIAHAVLRATAGTDQGRRAEAISMLEADGDVTFSGHGRGDAPGADALLAQAAQPGPVPRNLITALGRTRDARAVAPLSVALNDPDPIVRAAAADALGSLSQPQTVPSLQSLLQDPVFAVRMSAATALHAMHDDNGTAFLREAASSQFGAIRIVAARALKDDAGPDWMATVRRLTTDEDPAVRREAAELIAPHDAELASATLKPLLDDPNPAIRQVARESYIDAVLTDLTTLKRYLRDQDATTRVRAAGRVLQLTRQ